MKLCFVIYFYLIFQIFLIMPISNSKVTNKVKNKTNSRVARIVHNNKNKEGSEFDALIAYAVIKSEDVAPRSLQKPNNLDKNHIFKSKNNVKRKSKTEKIINTRLIRKNLKSVSTAKKKVGHVKLNKYDRKGTPLPIFLSLVKIKKPHHYKLKTKRLQYNEYETSENIEASKNVDNIEDGEDVAKSNGIGNSKSEALSLKALDNLSSDAGTTSHFTGKPVTLCSTKKPLPELDASFLPTSLETPNEVSFEKRAESDSGQVSEPIESTAEVSEEADDLVEMADETDDEQSGEIDEGQMEMLDESPYEESGQTEREHVETPEEITDVEGEPDQEQMETPKDPDEEDGEADKEQIEKTEETIGEESGNVDEDQTVTPDEVTVVESGEPDEGQIVNSNEASVAEPEEGINENHAETSNEENLEEVTAADKEKEFMSTRYLIKKYVPPNRVTTVAYYIDDEK